MAIAMCGTLYWQRFVLLKLRNLHHKLVDMLRPDFSEFLFVFFFLLYKQAEDINFDIG